MDKICGIYKITSPSDRIYIGQSLDIYNRFKGYKNIHIKLKKQPILYNSFLKYGVANHIFEIVEECSIELLNDRERYWQEFYEVTEKGLNCILTKTNSKKGVFSTQTRENMSKAFTGRKYGKSWNKGKTGTCSKETLEKMSNSQKGHTSWNKGKKYPQITGEKHPFWGIKKPEFSENQKGKKNHMYGKVAPNAKAVIDIETKQEFSSIREAAKFYNLKEQTLRSRIQKESKNKPILKIKNQKHEQ
ncbi:MAG: NUMOD3 domain-containing DNA-binding protein [Alphaproteobacteria bacterium]